MTYLPSAAERARENVLITNPVPGQVRIYLDGATDEQADRTLMQLEPLAPLHVQLLIEPWDRAAESAAANAAYDRAARHSTD